MQIVPNKLYLAISAAFFIAYNANESQPVSGSAIIEYSGLNKRALEPVLQKLSNARLIISLKGAKGGYYMPDPGQTSLRDVADIFINAPTTEKMSFAGYDNILGQYLVDAHNQWLDSLAQQTFKKLCDQANKSGKLKLIREPVLNFTI